MCSKQENRIDGHSNVDYSALINESQSASEFTVNEITEVLYELDMLGVESEAELPQSGLSDSELRELERALDLRKNVQSSVYSTIENPNIFHTGKAERIDAIAAMLNQLDKEKVDEYFEEISAFIFDRQLGKYLGNKKRPAINSAEFQFLMLLNKYQGTVIRKLFIKAGISDYNINKYVKKYGLVELDKGIYMDSDSLLDREFILTSKYTKSVISHETALFYHGLTDVPPYTVYISFPQGYNLNNILQDSSADERLFQEVKFVRNAAINESEIAIVDSTVSNPIPVTTPERSISDILKPAHHAEEEIKITAISRYVRKNTESVTRLRRAAKQQGVLKMLDHYLERVHYPKYVE